MMNKKGIEGLPLKYLVVALVASLVIAVALQMTNTIQESVTDSSKILADKTTGMVISATQGEKYTTGFENVGVLAWSFNSSGTLKLSILNEGANTLNIDYINASFNGVDAKRAGKTLQPGESTEPLNFVLSTASKSGDPVSISVVVVMTDASIEKGTLVGIAE